jgi:hypothetical protein
MKRPLTASEKRTIRIAAIGVAAYLALFYGLTLRDALAARRAQYDTLVQQAKALRDVISPYQDKIAATTNLMDRFRMDPAKLKRSTVLGEASAAIQREAMAEKIVVGPVRETPGRPSARELGSIQFDASGPIPAVLALLHNLSRVGFPVIIDTMQITSDPRMPNGVKASLTIVVLDFDAWKPKEENAHA